jgi:hypothetical protein
LLLQTQETQMANQEKDVTGKPSTGAATPPGDNRGVGDDVDGNKGSGASKSRGVKNPETPTKAADR